jgi:hypothetical protein
VELVMHKTAMTKSVLALALAGLATSGTAQTPASPAPAARAVDPARLPAAGRISPRFLSYNVEMVEVTGGRFWRPYDSPGADRYEYRPPMNLGDPRLRKLAAALGPAYVRYSGSWANATYFADTDRPPEKAPEGFDTVLTRQQWRNAVAFARAVNARIVTSFATSTGTRGPDGVWRSDMAARWLAYTRRIGGTIAATEFGNEPNMLRLIKGPPGYDYAGYRRDYALFARWLRQASPRTLLLAPGAAELGEPTRSMSRNSPEGQMGEAGDIFEAGSPRPDAVSFHFYGGASERCGGPMLARSDAQARSPQWLAAIDAGNARTAAFRDAMVPGAPLWNTEAAETVCGGNRIARTFSDTFRFVDQLARSARQGVEVFMHNTLAASDYGLLDEKTHAPRPNYWAALVWKRLIGEGVLDAGSNSGTFNLYAHCLKGSRGGVVLVAVNLDGVAARSLTLGRPALAHVLTEGSGGPQSIALNGTDLALGENDRLPPIAGARVTSGTVSLPARSVSFIAIPGAGNRACR